MSLLKSLLDKLWPCRHGTFVCPCGAVQFSLQVPGSSYGIIEQTNAICHCNDCVRFVQACPNGMVVMENNATHMVQFYKSDVSVVQGQDQIGFCKLRSQTRLIRFYCKECGTPLGADFTFGPIMLLYSKFIKGVKMPLYLPSLVFNYASSPSETTRSYDRRVTVCKGILCPTFIVSVISRVLLGFLMGKGSSGFSVPNADSVPVGLGKIATKKR